MPKAGIEPARDFSQRILSPLRLPIPPLRHGWQRPALLSALLEYHSLQEMSSANFLFGQAQVQWGWHKLVRTSKSRDTGTKEVMTGGGAQRKDQHRSRLPTGGCGRSDFFHRAGADRQ